MGGINRLRDVCEDEWKESGQVTASLQSCQSYTSGQLRTYWSEVPHSDRTILLPSCLSRLFIHLVSCVLLVRLYLLLCASHRVPTASSMKDFEQFLALPAQRNSALSCAPSEYKRRGHLRVNLKVFKKWLNTDQLYPHCHISYHNRFYVSFVFVVVCVIL